MNTGLRKYWCDLFPRLWNLVLFRMMTCDGKYRLEQLELVPRFWNDMFVRYEVFYDKRDLFAYCMQKKPKTLQMGGVFPLLHTGEEEEQEEGDGEQSRGALLRQADRALVKAGVTSFKSPFVIDIDMSEKINRIGVCACVNVEMCTVCWQEYMHSARLIVDYLLRDVLKLKRIMHFWSGRRGVHIWCFDERAYEWTKAERANIMAMLRNRDMCLHLLPEELRALRWPMLDADVSIDPQHCKGIPLGPHHSTGAIRVLLPPLSSGVVFDPQHELTNSHMNRVDMYDLDVFLKEMNKIMDE